MKKLMILIVFAALILGACNAYKISPIEQPDPDKMINEPADDPKVTEEIIEPPTGENPSDDTNKGDAEAPQVVIDLAIADLAERAGVTASEVTLVKSQAIVWPDAALGVHEEGMMYAQVETPGFILTLEAGGNQYIYHTSMDRVVFAGDSMSAF